LNEGRIIADITFRGLNLFAHVSSNFSCQRFRAKRSGSHFPINLKP
jgi:hypothetical protein